MSKVSKLKLEEIFSSCGFLFNSTDILYFCKDDDTISKYLKLCGKENQKELKKFLIENEEKIDKEKLVFCLFFNYVENLKRMEERIKELIIKKTDVEEYAQLIEQKKIQEKYKNKTLQLGKDIDVYLLYQVNNNQGYSPEIISSKELFGKRKLSEKKNLERWNEIDNEIGDAGDGTIYVIQIMLLSDLSAILPTLEIGMAVRECILNNCALKREGLTIKQLDNLRRNDFKQYTQLIDSASPEEYLPAFRKEIIKNIRFIDIDKLLLISGYRIESCLEKNLYRKEAMETVKSMLYYIRGKIENEKKEYRGVLQNQKTYEQEEVEFSYKDLEKCINRFIGDDYIKKSEVSQAKEDLILGKITLEDLESPIFNLIELNEEEIEQMMPHSIGNFVYGIKKLGYEESEITERLSMYPDIVCQDLLNYLYEAEKITINSLIKLYNSKTISAEFFKEFSEETDISSEINLHKINERYLQIKEAEAPNEEQISDLDTMIKFYKIINLDSKSPEELEEESNNVMYELAEEFEGEEDLLFYYEKGLLTLETVAEWGEDTVIQKLYDESKITFEEIEEANIDIKVKQAVLGKIIISKAEEYEQSTLLEYIEKQYLSEKDILNLYRQALLNDTYADEMLNKGIISTSTYIEINNIGKEILEEQAHTKFSDLIAMDVRNFSLNLVDDMEESNLSIGDIPTSKLRNLQGSEKKKKNNGYSINTRTTESLIDPNIRWQFLKALKCKLPKDKNIINHDPNNPFYNYEFYVIGNSNENDVQKDSIVIGERFFKDKLTEDEFATSNATYIWQYKDYLIAQRMLEAEKRKNKKAVLEETEGVVYVANHRPGSWAISLLYKIAQAKAGESFNKYKKGEEKSTKVIEQLEKLYTHEQLIKILDLARIIDDRQAIIMPNGEEVGIVYDVIKETKRIVGHGGNEDNAR